MKAIILPVFCFAGISATLLNSLTLATSSHHTSNLNQPQVDLGVWDFDVDLDRQEVKMRKISGQAGVKIAALMGNPVPLGSPGVTFGQIGSSIINNSTGNLVKNTTGTGNYASLSIQLKLTNTTGSTLGLSDGRAIGEPLQDGITGVKLLFVPRSDCPITPAPTLSQPFCVTANSSQLIPGTGASGRYQIDPVYLSYIRPRNGTNLGTASVDGIGGVEGQSNPDNLAALELNEATGRIGIRAPDDFARTIWQPGLTIANGSTGTFGIRFRYAQDVGSAPNQPRVSSFSYRMRILADRAGGKVPQSGANNTPGNNYVTTLAGPSWVDRSTNTLTTRQFDMPKGVAISPDGARVYVVEQGNSLILVIGASQQVVSILAGSTDSRKEGYVDAVGTAAKFNNPTGLTMSRDGKTFYVADTDNQLIRQIDATSATVTTLAGLYIKSLSSSVDGRPGYADGVGDRARFNFPTGIAITPDGTTLYVADSLNHRIREIDIASKTVFTLAGSSQGFMDGRGQAAEFDTPSGVAVSPDGKTLYVADTENNRIRQINLDTRDVTTLAQNLTGSPPYFFGPNGVAVSHDGQAVYVADENDSIQKVDVTSKTVTRVAGLRGGAFVDGAATVARLFNPTGIVVSPTGGKLYVTDSGNNRIREIQAIEGQAP